MKIIHETNEHGLNIGLREDDAGNYYLYWVKNSVSNDEMQSRPMQEVDLIEWATKLYNPVGYASLPVMAEFIIGVFGDNAQ